jgi:hypothetical protein
MLTYKQLKEKPKAFLVAATGLMINEFERLYPVFKEKLATQYPQELRARVRDWVLAMAAL